MDGILFRQEHLQAKLYGSIPEHSALKAFIRNSNAFCGIKLHILP